MPSACRLVAPKPMSASENALNRPGACARFPAYCSTGYGFRKNGSSFFQPGIFVRREHRKRCAALGQNFIFLENDLVLAREECTRLQRLCDRCIARERHRLVIMIGVHRLHAQRSRQPGNFHAGTAVQDDQLPAARRQVAPEFVHRLQDEFDATVAARWQNIKDFSVVDKNAINAARRLQRGVEGCVVGDAQVAAKPHQRGIGSAHRENSPGSANCGCRPPALQ